MKKYKLPLLTTAFVIACLLAAVIFVSPLDAMAQKITVDLGSNASSSSGDNGNSSNSVTSRIIQLVVLVTIIPLAPSIAIMVTSFTRIIIVLSLLRTALGLQQTPPNQVLISLALFLTLFIMYPVFQKSYDDGIAPLVSRKIDEKEAWDKSSAPFHAFMMKNVREKDLRLFLNMSPDIKIDKPEDTPFRILIPAFMIGELKRAFEIGFLVYLPFLIIDMLVASTLMAMGIMMLPPVLISLPFKLIFFVIVDGWYSLSGSLVRSFGMP